MTWPTWKDRQGYGRQLPLSTVVKIVADDEHGGLEWRHVGVIATMIAESDLHEWSRPMVWSPDKVHHLSVDRGICALNSYWWADCPDDVAYDPPQAFHHVLAWLRWNAGAGLKGATEWDWRPLLDWQWHAYGTDRYLAAVPKVREAVNAERETRGMERI